MERVTETPGTPLFGAGRVNDTKGTEERTVCFPRVTRLPLWRVRPECRHPQGWVHVSVSSLNRTTWGPVVRPWSVHYLSTSTQEDVEEF